jgi:hypothetical protein
MQKCARKARKIGRSIENDREITGNNREITGNPGPGVQACTWLFVTPNEDDVVIASEPSIQVGSTS